MKLIDANTVVTIQVFNDMTGKINTKKMTVADAIDEWSDEGCPPTVQAIPIEWINKKSLEFLTNKNFRYATDFQEVIDMWKVENNIPLFDGELKITWEKENG